MKKILALMVALGGFSLYGQQPPTELTSSRYLVLDIPEVEFFCNLYRDDFIGDTLLVDGKNYFFSQSPMKQFPGYMLGQTDHRLVEGFGKPLSSLGMPDKGYVLHFSVGKGGVAQVDRATYNGGIYPEDYNYKPVQLDRFFASHNVKKEKGAWVADWLDGRYRLNGMQPDPLDPNKNERYIAVFKKGKLVEICEDTDKKNFNPPMIDLQEKPKGVAFKDFSPEYVYYKSSDGMRKEKIDDVKKEWRDRLMQSYHSEPFLDKSCGEALMKAWVKGI